MLVGHEIPTAAVAEALRAAGERGATTILNPAPASGLDAATVALAELVTPNEGELATLREAGVRAERVLVSLGSEGADLRTSGGSVRIPALSVEAVDTVGCGRHVERRPRGIARGGSSARRGRASGSGGCVARGHEVGGP